ncbi:MAG: hypothetical protein ABFD84_08915 [Candidatus Polarisedimenticolia bacterium]
MTLDEALRAISAPVDSRLKEEAAQILYDALRRLARGVFSDPVRADDAVQQVMFNLVERTVPPGGETVRTEAQAGGYLRACLRNARTDDHRRAKTQMEIDALPPERQERETWLDDAATPPARPEFDRLDEERARRLLSGACSRLENDVFPRVRAAGGAAAGETLDIVEGLVAGRLARAEVIAGLADGGDAKSIRAAQNRFAQRVTRLFAALERATLLAAEEGGWSAPEAKAASVVLGELRLAARGNGQCQQMPEAAS